MSDGKNMSRTTFNRHKDAIQEMFGIYIVCDKTNGYRYHIDNEYVLKENSVQNWMLSTLSVNNIISESLSVQERILLESIPSNGSILSRFIDAMKKNLRVKISYLKYGQTTESQKIIEPFCIKLYSRRWYVLGRTAKKEFRVYSFDRITSLCITNETFVIPKNFDAQQFFNEYFGVVQGDGTACERIVLRAFDIEQYRLRDLPIHHTQKKIAEGNNFTDFEYRFRPTLDFASFILSRATQIKVIEPRWLAEQVRDMHKSSMELYEKNKYFFSVVPCIGTSIV